MGVKEPLVNVTAVIEHTIKFLSPVAKTKTEV